MVNGAIYLPVVAGYDFFVNRPLRYVINQQQHNEEHPRVASTRHTPQILLLCGAPDYIVTHRIIRHAYNSYFILFMSRGLALGMCNRLNSLVYNDRLKLPLALGSYWERVECRLTYLSFASF